MPGEYYSSVEKELISTLLGSCVAVCLYDEKRGIGGMNHFLLPSSSEKNADGGLYSSARYGVNAMESLILQMQLKGADRNRLTAKVFGGGNVLSVRISADSVGERNIRFIDDYLKTERINVLSRDVGGDFSRKILFNTEDYTVKLTKTPVNATVAHDEEEYMKRLAKMHQSTQTIYF